MAQSYGNSAISTITAAVDEILGAERADQLLGTSVSGRSPADTTGIDSFDLNVDAAGVQTITLAVNNDPQDIAADIQAKAIAAGFAGFTARYDAPRDRYILTSATAASSPATASVIVVNGAGTAASTLKLGTAQSGTEAVTGSEIVNWTIHYRFVYDSGKSFSAAAVSVLSEDMVDPTDATEAKTLGNLKAIQLKAERTPGDNAPPEYTTTLEVVSISGPVTL